MKRLKFLFPVLFVLGIFAGFPIVSLAETVSLPISVEEDYTKAADLLDEINHRRTINNLRNLKMDSDLQEIAMTRAAELTIAYSHRIPRDPNKTALDQYREINAENIAMGSDSYLTICKDWGSSKETDQAMLNADIYSCGIGCVSHEGEKYWVFVTSKNKASSVGKTSGKRVSTRSIKVDSARIELYLYGWDSAPYGYKTPQSYGIYYNKAHAGWTAGIFARNIFERSAPGCRISTDDLKFSSTSPMILSVVQNGLVIPLNVGTGSITATLKSCTSVKGTFPVQVLPNIQAGMPAITIIDGISFNGNKKFTYTGKPICPKVRLVDCYGSELIEGQDYTLEYDANTNVGLGIVKAYFRGNYSTGGTNSIYVAKSFYIMEEEKEQEPGSGSQSGGSTGGNTGSPGNTGGSTGSGEASGGGQTGTGSSESVGGNTGNGQGGSSLQQGGNSTTGGTVNAVSVPKVTLQKAVSPSRSAMTVKWKKQKKTSGYQIQYALNKKFTKGKKVKNIAVKVKKKGKKTYITSKTFRGLKSKKTYYVRMRAYKKINGKKYYSVWSKVKTVRVK